VIDVDGLTRRIIKLALDEDCVSDDITTNALLDFDREILAEINAKETGVISGLKIFERTLKMVDSSLTVHNNKKNGDRVENGDLVIRVQGNESSILKAERTALNFLQRLSGIASLTAEFVKMLYPNKLLILDTRKTTPGMRYLQKDAVRDGGGTNHRMNLADMAMIKDNHIAMAGSITRAVHAVRKYNPEVKIEVEVKKISQLREALRTDTDIIMLDNFNRDEVLRAVELKTAEVKYEISGNVSLENLHRKIIKGIDYISVGALTHSFKSLDLSLNIVG
jgi:nicotinate-nucleotide pyrophosphorylase (carboxylating)